MRLTEKEFVTNIKQTIEDFEDDDSILAGVIAIFKEVSLDVAEHDAEMALKVNNVVIAISDMVNSMKEYVSRA